MTVAPIRDQPGRSPQGPAGAAPAPLPTGPPHPALMAVGFNGSIHDFNQRLAAAAAAHVKAVGTKPTPGVALDVTRSTVPVDHFEPMFTGTPQMQRQAQAKQTIVAHQQANPFDYFVTRPDGIVQPNTPFYHHAVPALAEPQQPAQRETLPTLLKKYPMVTMGALPIPGADALYKALHSLNAAAAPQKQDTLTPEQMLAMGRSPDVQISAAEEASLYGTSGIDRTIGAAKHDVQTVKQAQVELNKAMGTSLPATGVFNDTWTAAVSNWQKSTSYFHQQLQFQAQQAGFGNNVDGYAKAWQQKQHATSHGLYGHFLEAMPLPLFGHGSFWDDLASLPVYLKGSSNNPLNIGLHGLTRTTGLTLDTVGGTVSQAKADLAAGTTFAAYVAGLHGDVTYEQALKKARAQLDANPSYMRIFAGGFLPTEEHGRLIALDQLTNVLGDLILLRKPQFTGERVAAGDLAAAGESTYVSRAAGWAYQDLKQFGRDGVGRAASRMEGGRGSQLLARVAAPLIKRGDMTQEQFTQHLAELYATGRTTVTLGGNKTIELRGPTLTSLRTDRLPSPGSATSWLLDRKQGLRHTLDDFDKAARGSNSGLVNRANDVVQTVRSAVSHAAPEGGRLGYFQDILPERVFNFVQKHDLGDTTLANKLESDIVRFQAVDNVVGIQRIERQIKQLYHAKYGRGQSLEDDPFTAILETEAPSVFKFPGRAPDAEKAFSDIDGFTRKLNAGLNKAAKIHARIILSGLNPAAFAGAAAGGAVAGPAGALAGFALLGPGRSLFWKHLVGDGIRAIVGGVGESILPSTRRARAELAQLAASDPEVGRQYGALLERLQKGETAWALNRGGWNITTKSFRTGDAKDAAEFNAAGDFLRRQLDSNALDAYRSGNPQDLVSLILSDRKFRGIWHSLRKDNPDLSAEDYAALIADRYKGIEDALSAAGLTWDDATAVLRANVGAKAGKALGKLIKDNHLDFPVDHGQVESLGTFDDLTGRYVGNVIMAPNKFWRRNLGATVMAKHFGILRQAGFDAKDAFQIAAPVAERVTKYHMLDFANRLQIEQDLRWLSYFATKHRLYFKWVLSTFTRHPLYAAAAYDFEKTLNQQGGVSLPFKVLGQNWQVPLERLVWVPGREYDETSPLALATWNFVKSGGNLDAVVTGAAGTQGNVLTRSDTSVVLGVKLMKIELGAAPASYNYARSGLDKKTQSTLTRALNEYQLEHYREHGSYATERQAVKIVLLHQLGQEYWRANLPLPVVPETDRSDQQKLLAQYMAIVDPAERRKFIDDHPGFSDHFGVYDDPRQFLHNKVYFERWTHALDAYHSARRDLYADAKKQGEWTFDLEQKRRDLNAALERTQQKLLVDDAHSAGVDTKGQIPNGTTIPYGPWGRVVNKDPQFDPENALSALFPKLHVKGDVVGPLQRQMQLELSQLNDTKYVRSSNYTPDEVKTRKRELLQALEVFKNYPTDALGAVRDKYQTSYVNKYWQQYDVRVKQITASARGDRKTLDSEFRAWRDSQDHPVKINGIMFPSPARMAWAMLDPQTKQQRLSYLASKPVTSLADYELDLLGVKHPQHMSEVWAAVDKATADYREKHPGSTIGKDQIAGALKALSRQPGYGTVYAFYVNTVEQPRIRQFQQTTLYQDMPPSLRTSFDQGIGANAVAVAAAIKKNGSAGYYKQQWRNAVKTQIQPWLDEPDNKPLKAYLEPYGPDFLNDLVG